MFHEFMEQYVDKVSDDSCFFLKLKHSQLIDDIDCFYADKDLFMRYSDVLPELYEDAPWNAPCESDSED